MAFLFNTILTPVQYALPDNQEFSLALGTITLVRYTATQSLTFVGIAAVGGNVNGMVAVFMNLNNNASLLSFAHNSSLASSPANRCQNPSQITVTGGSGAGSFVYYYDGTILRWIMIGHS